MGPRTPPHLTKQPCFFTDTTPPPHSECSAPATPLSSRRHKGPHRDGFSVKKCRSVLVRQCSWIPRNYNFKDGVNQVYEVLREYLGDENMDLAIAQLNELIEVPSQWPHDEGASFQAWKHDYMVRHKDFENSHVPRLRNIIVAPVKPTARLKKWREDHPEREPAAISSSQSSQTPSSNSDMRPIPPDYGIGTGARGGNWRLENALFVSSRAQGTRVLHCPSAQELHQKTWNEDFGRGGKFVQERVVNPGEPVDGIDNTLDHILPLKRKKSFVDLRSMRSFVEIPVLQRIQSINFVPERLNASLHRRLSAHGRGWRSEQASMRKMGQARARHDHSDPLLGRFATEVKMYEGDPAVKDLPDPESDIGKPYYSNIVTWPLPPGTYVPSPRFARKHDLVPEEMPLPGRVVIRLVPTADEVAIGKNFHNETGSQSPGTIDLTGPFTPELFKDSGIDFPQHWEKVENVPVGGKFDVEALSDMGALGDSAHSPSKHPKSTGEGIPVFSSISAVTGSGKEYLGNTLNGPSRLPSKIRRLESLASAPDTMMSNGRRWHYLTWNRCPTDAPCDATLIKGGIRELQLILNCPLTDLTKASQQALSESHPFQDNANLAPALQSTEHDSLKILNPLVPYQSENATFAAAKNCDIMEPTNPIQSSTVTVIRNCSSSGIEIEPGEKNKSSPLNDIPTITRNSPADGSIELSTQIWDSEKVSTRKTRHRYKIGPLTIGKRQRVMAANHNFDSTMMEENANMKSAMELAIEMLQGTGHVHLAMMLNCGFSGAESYICVLNNNNDKVTAAMSKCENNNISSSLTDSPGGASDIPLTLIHERQNTKGCSSGHKSPEMDLNRDLPPLPFTTDPQSLKLGDQSQQQSLQSARECATELLQPLYYDPVRDSLKYGGLHYHPDGMRYYPEVLQSPPRTSSMPQSDTLLTTAGGSTQHQVKAKEPLQTSRAVNPLEQNMFEPTRAFDASDGSEKSSGIMGNFIPVKTVPSSSFTVTRAVQLQRIETDFSARATGQNSKPVTADEKASTQVRTHSQKTSKKIENSSVKYPDSLDIRQDHGGTLAPSKDHGSIDLNDPDALAKYIQQLKNMKNQPRDIEKQSFGPNASLSQNFDGEADRCVNFNDADDYTFVDSDEDTEAPRFIAQDYSEIRAGNPFEFEPDDIQNDPDRITTFTDFMGGTNKTCERSNAQDSTKRGHLKNSHSESNAFYTKRRPEPIQVVEHNNASRYILQRSDSSPSISPMRNATRRGVAQGSLQSFYEEDDRLYNQISNRNRNVNDLSTSPTHGRGRLRNPAKQLDDVSEKRETIFETPSPTQKRPWSPVKKIFGEGGWLNNTTTPKDVSATLKKPGLVEKIKLKIEEIGLKADLNPMKHPSRSGQEKSWVQSTFPISLNPAQQAELYLDIELLICDSANTFLMDEYHNGRMSVDSLKKVTDFWKSKGRPQVVEFHYDQSTQRDLIVANQKTFRFYGPNAKNPLKVNAMLYAWKTDAREMGIRTFCYPDSMIRKHIRDAFVILDFLGGHPFQYIAAHEVQKKLVAWINEVNAHSGATNIQKVGRLSQESITELVVGNPWHSSSNPIQHPNKESNGSGNA